MVLPKIFVISQPTLVAIEQWFCFLLGILCMASGVWGLCMSDSEELLGSAFVPVLWVTAAACVGVGGELVRLGFAKTLPISKLSGPRSTNKPGTPEARQGTREGCQVASPHNQNFKRTR
jgi:hypothetical protein